MSSLISIVVPVYNTKTYLDRCLESITNQTYKKLQIVLVDDGSKDGSEKICDEWEKKDARISVIHKDNAGLGMARNTGINASLGQYISFIDSDDFIENTMIEKMLGLLESNEADTCYCSLQKYSNEKNNVTIKNPIEAGVFDGKAILEQIIGTLPYEKKDVAKEMSVCAGLFSLELIKKHNILFMSEREYISEDLLFDVQYLPYSHKVVQMEEAYYNYCISENSLTHRYIENRIEKELKQYFAVLKALHKIYNNKDVDLRVNRLFLGRVRNCVIQEVKYSHHSHKNMMNEIKKIISNPSVQQIVSKYPYMQNPLKQRIFNCLLRKRAVLPIFILTLLH